VIRENDSKEMNRINQQPFCILLRKTILNLFFYWFSGNRKIKKHSIEKDWGVNTCQANCVR
ncbi:hypothetical protein ABFV55_27970, partial [Pseudomonas syringae]|uniref:hypothetical protein n=1 Tax=Pseudomonas syringae TaxID=317 RepID=UPI0034D9879F